MAQLVVAHLNTPPPQPSTSQPKVPAQVDEVIATGMAKDPDQRYATTVELASAAHNAITTPIPRAAVGPAPEPPTHAVEYERFAAPTTRPVTVKDGGMRPPLEFHREPTHTALPTPRRCRSAHCHRGQRAEGYVGR